MPSTPYPDSAARNEYDALILDGMLFNFGLVEFDGDGIKRKLKVRGTPGANGSSVRDRGSDTVEFKMTVEYWEPGHWQAGDALLAVLNPRTVAPGRAQRVHIIDHPVLAQVDIAQAYFRGAGLLKKVKLGHWSQEFTWLEWEPVTNSGRSVTRRPTVVPPAGNVFSQPGTAQIRPNGTTLAAIPPPSATATGPRR